MIIKEFFFQNSRTKCTFLEFQEFSRTKVIFKDFSRSVRTLLNHLTGYVVTAYLSDVCIFSYFFLQHITIIGAI